MIWTEFYSIKSQGLNFGLLAHSIRHKIKPTERVNGTEVEREFAAATFDLGIATAGFGIAAPLGLIGPWSKIHLISSFFSTLSQTGSVLAIVVCFFAVILRSLADFSYTATILLGLSGASAFLQLLYYGLYIAGLSFSGTTGRMRHLYGTSSE